MSRDRTWIIEFMDDRAEEIWASPRVEGNVLVMTEYFGVTGGVKQQTMYPLENIRRWREKPQQAY